MTIYHSGPVAAQRVVDDHAPGAGQCELCRLGRTCPALAGAYIARAYYAAVGAAFRAEETIAIRVDGRPLVGYRRVVV